MEDRKQIFFNLITILAFFAVAWFIFFGQSSSPELPIRVNRSSTALVRDSAPRTVSQFSNFSMAVTSAKKVGETVGITTTGAYYVLSRTGMELWRRIDPATNTVNPRKVAALTFNNDIGPLVIKSADASIVVVESSLARFEFYSDSLFLVSAISPVPLTYTHTNLIPEVSWQKGAGRDRMWTDGYGGSLHARIISYAAINNTSSDSTTFTVSTGQTLGHMVFPPKPFDFESLYGAGARPFVEWVYGRNIDAVVEQLLTNPNAYIEDGFGVFVLFGNVYENLTGIHEDPEVLETGILGYNFADETKVRQLVALAHSKGFKVVTYMYTPAASCWNYPAGHPLAGQHQDIAVTLEWMRSFQEEFNLDGWNFDNADVGSLWDDYNFMRQVRTDIGDEGIISHHNSVDVWGLWSGLRAVMVDAYVDYTLTGETGELAETDDPNDPYLRYYSSGYGLSQTYGAHKRKTRMDVAISEAEAERVMGENLNGVERIYDASWRQNFKAAYDLRRAEYLSGSFNPDVTWPINLDTGWFRKARNVSITYGSPTQAIVAWETNEAANSEVIYTSNKVWWVIHPDRREVIENTLATNHTITLNGLTAGTNYEFRIRSRNGLTGTAEVVWGYVSGDQDDPPPPPSLPPSPITPAPTPVPVTPVPSHPIPDLTPPQSILNLEVKSAESKSATFTWIAPYQDLTNPASGPIANYDLRYGRDPITETNWSNAAEASGEPAPTLPGQSQTYVLVNLGMGKTYHAAIKSSDAAGNVSALSNLVQFDTDQEPPPPPVRGGGGGSGGVSSDTTPPAPPVILTSYGFDHQAILNWRNPTDADFVRVLILRSVAPLPIITSPGNPHYLTQAVAVYDGAGSTFTDINLINGQFYYYTLYAYDRAGNYAPPVTATVRAAGGRQDLILQLMRRLLELLQQLLALVQGRSF